MFQCLSLPKFDYVPIDIQNKIKKYYQNISYIKYALKYQSYIISICEYIEYSTNISNSDKIEKLKSYDFSEYMELSTYFYESYYQSNSNKDFIENFYKKIYNKHIMLQHLIIAYERENKIIYPKISNYL
jgi:hypothetical protein